jgi:hypothetical protein
LEVFRKRQALEVSPERIISPRFFLAGNYYTCAGIAQNDSIFSVGIAERSGRGGRARPGEACVANAATAEAKSF